MEHAFHAPLPPRLLLITRPEAEDTARLLHTLEAALQGGVDAVLLRKKELDSARLLAIAAAMRALTHEYHARLLIHTQLDVCLAVGADGVHLASCDIVHAGSLRQQLGDECSISASCHDAGQLRQAEQNKLDFALLSPVFATRSHPETQPMGVKRFHQLQAECVTPLLALGGITPHNRPLLQCPGVAVIRALWDADDPVQTAQTLLQSHPYNAPPQLLP